MEETFSFSLYGKGEYPQFTKPQKWREAEVPEVLLSGNHKHIEQYKRESLANCSGTEHTIMKLRNDVFNPEKPYKTPFPS